MTTGFRLRRSQGLAGEGGFKAACKSRCKVATPDKHDLEVRVGQKESADPIPVCYCFDISVTDLRKSITAAGETDIPAMITAQIRAGHCACEVKNPQGSCRLGNVSKALNQIRFEAASTTLYSDFRYSISSRFSWSVSFKPSRLS
jgi:hypothetical protein